jgi:ferrous iron transport protein A
VNLAALKPGDTARITRISVTGPLKRRLMDMGVLVGEEIKLTKIAPMGDPLEINVKNYCLSLRKNEAESIGVEVLND